MHDEIEYLADLHRPAFKRLVSYLYHSEPLSNCDFLVEQCGPDLTTQLEAIQDAYICVEHLREDKVDYDSVHEWSLS